MFNRSDSCDDLIGRVSKVSCLTKQDDLLYTAISGEAIQDICLAPTGEKTKTPAARRSTLVTSCLPVNWYADAIDRWKEALKYTATPPTSRSSIPLSPGAISPERLHKCGDISHLGLARGCSVLATYVRVPSAPTTPIDCRHRTNCAYNGA